MIFEVFLCLDGWSSSVRWLCCSFVAVGHCWSYEHVLAMGRILLHPRVVWPPGLPGRECLFGLEDNTKEQRWNWREVWGGGSGRKTKVALSLYQEVEISENLLYFKLFSLTMNFKSKFLSINCYINCMNNEFWKFLYIYSSFFLL